MTNDFELTVPDLYIANEKGEINTVEKSKLKCTLVLTPPKNEC